MSDQFALRFPFRPLNWVTGVEQPAMWEEGGRRFTLSASKPYLVLHIEPFSTEEMAATFLPRAWDAAAWMALQSGIGFAAEMNLHSIVLAEDPEKAGKNLRASFGLAGEGPVHGVVNGNFPVVLPIGKVIKFITVGDVTATVTSGADRILPLLQEGLRSAGNPLYQDERFRTAVELFSDEAREQSLRSKFVTLVMALEVLASPRAKHAVAQKLLDDLERQLETEIHGHHEDSDEWAALDSLRRELLFRRQTSLRSRVRQLVLEGLSDLELAVRKEHAQEMVWAYDQRGTLLHEGRLSPPDLSRAYEIARRNLRALLAARMQSRGIGNPRMDPRRIRRR